MIRSVGTVATLLAACHAANPPCDERAGYVCTIAGTSELGFNDDGLAAAQTDLFLVSAARRGPDDLVWVMDFNNQRLRRIDEDGRMQTVIGSGFHAIASAESPALKTPLENPIDFGFFADGRPVFVSYHDARVITLGDDGIIHVVAGSGEVGVVGNEGDGGPALDAMFIQLDGIVVAPDDSIYVSDSKANRVRLIRDGVVTTVAGNGVAAYSGDGGPATAAGLSWPTALELDDAGNLYIADTFNGAIRRVTPEGIISTVAGDGTLGARGDGGPATAAQLDQPNGIAIADDGSIYIADRANFCTRRVGPNGIIERFAGTGLEGVRDGQRARAEFAYLARIALDGDALLLADQSNALVRRIDLR